MIGAAAGGVALLALVWSWHSRGQQIEILEARLDTCASQRAEITATNHRMAERIEAQNRAVAAREAETERRRAELAERARIAAERAERAESELAERLDSVERTAVPESVEERIAQCERARSYLVR